MHILIIEDEIPAAAHLHDMVQGHLPEATIHPALDSIEDAVEWLQQHDMPDLVFMDIHLADGLSFEILKQVDLTAPVIFTTAYNQYALDAFQANSIDYLLKPIERVKLEAAITKFQRAYESSLASNRLEALLAQWNPPTQAQFQERFLIKIGDQYRTVMTDDIAYFWAEEGMVYLMDQQGKKLPVDDKLESIEARMDPRQFFRINRKFLVRLRAIARIHSWFNSRLKVELAPASAHEIVVSRERVAPFKAWLNS